MPKPAATSHPVHQLIRDRWSPRAFSERAVSAADLKSLLEAARWAASSYNEQPWRLIVATKEDGAGFAKMLGCLVEANQAWAKGAPVLMIMVKKDDFTQNGKPNRVALYDCGAAAAQLTMEATSRGLSVHQMAGIDQQKCRETYGIPAGFEAVTALALGYEGSPDTLGPELKKMETEARGRKGLGEIVFGGAFGTAMKGV